MRTTKQVGDRRRLFGDAGVEPDLRSTGGWCSRSFEPAVAVALAGERTERDPPGELSRHGEELRSHPATRAETQHCGFGSITAPETLREVQDVADVSAAEPIDGLVRITHDDEQPAVAGKPAQQPLLGRIRVLVFVDVDSREPRPQFGGRSVEQLRRLGNEAGVVELIACLENAEVFIEEVAGGDPCRVATVGAKTDQRRTVQTALACTVEQVGNLAREATKWQCGRELSRPARETFAHGVAPEQLADPHLALGA